MIEPFSALAIAGTVVNVINNVAIQIMAIKELIEKVKGADAHLMSIIAQLNAIKAALVAIQDLMQTANYNEQLQMDLDLSLQASQLHMDYIGSKIAKLKTKNASSLLKFRSRVRVVMESEGMEGCLERLNHQATALNLLITVLTSKTVNEQKAMLRRSNTRKVFRQIQEDKASLLDETASVNVMRDQDSVVDAMARTRSEPIISKNPWKRFSFDRQVLDTKAYGRKVFRRSVSEQEIISEEVPQVQPEEDLDDVTTLVADSEAGTDDIAKSPISPVETNQSRRFSRMLALGHAECDIPNLITHAQQMWNADPEKCPQTLARHPSVQMHRLSTRYFDLSIHSHTLISNHTCSALDDDLLATYRDVSSILFAVKLSAYHYNPQRMDDDLALFSKTVNNYHLILAKIILFLDTSDLDPYSAQQTSIEIEKEFMQAGRAGASHDRIHVVTGAGDESAAGTIFAVSNESGRVQANKWAGLTRWATD